MTQNREFILGMRPCTILDKDGEMGPVEVQQKNR